MTRIHSFAALLISVLIPINSSSAQEKSPAFQYRFKNASIPAATSSEPKSAQFSSNLVKDHLDLGATLWAKQKKCVSCHTHGIYMLTRPALTPYWGAPSKETRAFVVAQAKELQENNDRTGSLPVQMAYIARGLAAWDSQFRQQTSPETDAALRYLFEMQAEEGYILVKDRWPPLNSSTYHGTAMAAMAVANAPGWLANLDDAELLAKIDKLKIYLRETTPKNDHEGVLLLWASTYMTDLLTDERQQSLVNMIWKHQRDDGGWSIRTFATPESLGGGKRAESLRTDPNYQNPSSDGYQTGLAVVVLRDAGVAADDPQIKKAVKWLLSHQRESGRWWTRSLNTMSRFHFISYSGTAYSALALAKCGALATTSQSPE